MRHASTTAKVFSLSLALALAPSLLAPSLLPAQKPQPQASQPIPQPAPIGEMAPAPIPSAVWAGREAYAFSFVQQLAELWRIDQDYQHASPNDRLPGYSVVWIDQRDGYDLRLRATDTPPARLPASQTGLLYVVPTDDNPTATRAFCVRSDGVAAFTDNQMRTSQHGRRRLQAFDVLSETGANDQVPARFPTDPARGSDGNSWLPISMRATKTVSVRVRDDRGQPIQNARFSCMPAVPGIAVPLAVPAGRFTTTAEGVAEFEGVRATGLGFALWCNGQPVWIPAEFATTHEGAVRLELPHEWLRDQVMQQNELAVTAALVQLTTAQTQVQTSGSIDVDGDGLGEFATFGELTGRCKLRSQQKSRSALLSPPVLDDGYAVDRDGIVTRFGYHFCMFLPGTHGVPIAEGPHGGVHAKLVRTDRAEHAWHCYAWPVEAGRTGQAAFCVDQTGTVFRTSNKGGVYSGRDLAPKPHAAFGDHRDGRGRLKSERKGEDGLRWVLFR